MDAGGCNAGGRDANGGLRRRSGGTRTGFRACCTCVTGGAGNHVGRLGLGRGAVDVKVDWRLQGIFRRSGSHGGKREKKIRTARVGVGVGTRELHLLYSSC